MRAIDLALKDLRQLVRDWKAATFLVAMPIIFTFMFGFAFGGFGGQNDPRLPVGFLDRDGGAVLSTHLRSLLDASEVVRPVTLSATEDLDKKVRDEELAAVVIVPAGYSERTLAGALVALDVIVDQKSEAGLTAQSEIQATAARLTSAVQAAQLSAQSYAKRASFAGPEERQAFLREALDRAVLAWQDPPLTVTVTEPRTAAQGKAPISTNGFTHTSPSMMVQFAIAGLTGAAEIIVLERKSKALQRLLTTAMSRTEIILGHFLAMLAMILAQFVLLVAFGQLALRVDYLREPLAVLLVMVTMALWTAALGLLVGTLARTQDQVIIFSLIPMFIFAGLGGAWVPLEFTNPTFQTIGHFLPTAWAMDGFENIVVRGLGLNSALLPAGILLAYAVAFFALAAWRFRFE